MAWRQIYLFHGGAATTCGNVVKQSISGEVPVVWCRTQVGKHRLPCDRPLPRCDKKSAPGRKIDVHPRTETYHAQALPGLYALAFGGEGDDAPRDEARDLHHCDVDSG